MRGCGVQPLTNAEAANFLRSVYDDPAVSCEAEPVRAREIWLELARGPQASPLVWMDAYLAAFAICVGAEMVTLDRGFLRYRDAGLSVSILQSG